MEFAAQMKPDLLLLDIQMPGCQRHRRGCLLAGRLVPTWCFAPHSMSTQSMPSELAAADYLLKPVTRARLAQALDRVRSLGGERKEELLDEAVRSHRSRLTRFLVKQAEGIT